MSLDPRAPAPIAPGQVQAESMADMQREISRLGRDQYRGLWERKPWQPLPIKAWIGSAGAPWAPPQMFQDHQLTTFLRGCLIYPSWSASTYTTTVLWVADVAPEFRPPYEVWMPISAQPSSGPGYFTDRILRVTPSGSVNVQITAVLYAAGTLNGMVAWMDGGHWRAA